MNPRKGTETAKEKGTTITVEAFGLMNPRKGTETETAMWY